MVYIRRMVGYFATRLVLICILFGILACAFYMCLNTAGVYVVLNDGLQKRAETILTGEDAESLNFYFHADFLSTDPALEGRFDGTSVYDDYNINEFKYDLKIEKIWAWPWDNYATCTVVERIPEIKGSVIASRRNAVSSKIPPWQGGRYDLTLIRVEGVWKIIGMQQKTILMEAENITAEETPAVTE